ncbi:MAG TPA: sigma-54 dependent transcriptional regulator [Chitinophagaceae bacterium]|nr:sigma-54 dependent transcriptional regulator [Chitinophagaceae bacterium]
MRNRILIIDDDIDLCTLLARFLSKNGYETDMAHTGKKGIALFAEKKFDIVICDYRLGDMEGIEVISALKKLDPHVIVLVITGYSDIKTAVEVIRLGALDYITKPLIPDEVLSVLKKVLQPGEYKNNTDSPKIASATDNGKSPESKIPANEEFFVGHSPAAEALYAQVNIVAATNYSIILYGESGTGKEVIAKTIHEMSERRNNPFIAMDCGTLSKELSGSELFGHVKGAFTGALQDKEGHFEMANGGTLFLDEVGNLSPEVQATLLRVIQERKFKRVGGNKEIQVDVRIIVASNENLQEAYRRGKFREDLYHRFNEFSINLPPLRNRKEDIRLFANFFLKKTMTELNKEIKGFEDDVLQTFMEYSWPGNLREFRNVIRRSVLLTEPDKTITSATLPWEITNNSPFSEPVNPDRSSHSAQNGTHKGKEEISLKDAAVKAEFETIMTALQQVNFNKKKAAELLKIDRKTLYNKIKNYQA